MTRRRRERVLCTYSCSGAASSNTTNSSRFIHRYYFCNAAKNKKDLSRLVEHKFSKFYCTVCESNLKDTVLSTCFHTFCWNCVDKNLKTRHRKCALCNLPFGKGDVHKLYQQACCCCVDIGCWFYYGGIPIHSMSTTAMSMQHLSLLLLR